MNAVKELPYEAEMRCVCDKYEGDVCYSDLSIELPIFVRLIPEKDRSNFSIADLFAFFKKLSAGQKSMLPALVTLAKLLLVMPATNAESERIFSALKRVKTYMRATTSDDRLNHLMVMHVHKEELDNVNAVDVANSFVERSSDRQQIFGKFVEADIPTKVTLATKATQINSL